MEVKRENVISPSSSHTTILSNNEPHTDPNMKPINTQHLTFDNETHTSMEVTFPDISHTTMEPNKESDTDSNMTLDESRKVLSMVTLYTPPKSPETPLQDEMIYNHFVKKINDDDDDDDCMIIGYDSGNVKKQNEPSMTTPY